VHGLLEWTTFRVGLLFGGLLGSYSLKDFYLMDVGLPTFEASASVAIVWEFGQARMRSELDDEVEETR
jgi:hypothetical protein